MGKIIQIVGPSGSGKTSVQDGIREGLLEIGYNVTRIVEPGPWSEEVKNYRLNPDKDPKIEAMLFAFDRLTNYLRNVTPEINLPGRVFVSARGLADFYVYQGMQGEVPVEELEELSEFVPTPNMTLCLVVDGEVGARRCRERHEETGEPLSPNETPERINLLTSYYQRLDDHFANVHLIDTTETTVDEVVDQCLDYIWSCLSQDPSDFPASLQRKKIQDQMRELSEKFNISAYTKAPAMSFGSALWERAVDILLDPSKQAGTLVPFNKERFEEMLEQRCCSTECISINPFKGPYVRTVDMLQDRGYVENIPSPEGKLLVPTEKLLECVQVPYRN